MTLTTNKVMTEWNSSSGTRVDPVHNCTIEERSLVEFAIYGLLLNLVALLGIVGNSISVIVLSRPQMRSSINYLLIGLATCDTILIVLAVLLYGLPGIYAGTEYLFEYKYSLYPKIVGYLYPLSTTVQMSTVYITLTVTMERYVAVCLPLRARSLCTYSRARYALLVIAGSTFLYNLPRYWEIELSQEWHPEANRSVECVVGTKLRRNKLYIALYVHWMYFFFYYAFPFAALVVFNIAIYNNVRKANRDLRQLTRNQRSEIGLATMLLCVVIVFLICNFLPLVSNIYENVFEGPPVWLVQIGNLLVTINSGVNFVVYVIFGRKFKRIFLRLFCRVSNDLDKPGAGSSHYCYYYNYRADSPDFRDLQENEDSVATNTSNLELRNSVNRRGGGHQRAGSCRTSVVYYPGAAAAATTTLNNNNNNNNDPAVRRSSSGPTDGTRFC